jgi:hypothetical protein
VSGGRAAGGRASGPTARTNGRFRDNADDRPEPRPRFARKSASERDPEIPEGITAALLDRDVRAELAGLGKDLAADTGAHLAAIAHFIDDDPDRAWRHAVAARRRAARLGVVRETAGLAAYRAGRYADALGELRTARRINGSNVHLPVMADSERGLGRPERALEIAHGPEARHLDRDGRIELLIVESGARTDLGEHDAAVVVLQIPELDSPQSSPALARLRYAYSEALNRAAREKEADAWRARAMADDPVGAANLYAPEYDDGDIIDLLEEEDDEPGDEGQHEEPGEGQDEGQDEGPGEGQDQGPHEGQDEGQHQGPDGELDRSSGSPDQTGEPDETGEGD